ncbi:UDP-N-acetylmuramoyl-tripeptide--D-alanyl-D-alanine ligase [anaerobic digester metagenome]
MIVEKLTLIEIAQATGGKILFGNDDVTCESVVMDSRKVTENALFIGIKGEQVDGNDYFLTAFEQGATIALIEKDVDVIPTGQKGLVWVPSTRDALAALAKYYKNRSLTNTRFIAITGSVGKTTAKDMLCGMLSAKYKVFKTRGNYNNELGLPLMIFSMDSSHDFAVLEMGMSSLGEIHFLADIVRPDLALITNIGTSHIEILKTRENILKAKLEITDFFGPDQVLFLNADDPYLAGIKHQTYQIVTAGIATGIYRAKNISLEPGTIEFDALRGEETLGHIKLEVPGMHNVANGILCFACAHQLGISAADLTRMTIDRTVMRLEETQFEHLTVINDAYNASPESARAGLDTLALRGGRKVALMGDMKELGDYSAKAHVEVGAYARSRVDVLIAVGDFAKEYGEGFGSQDFHGYPTYEDAVIALPNLLDEGDLVYLKASRSMKFERFLSVLERI